MVGTFAISQADSMWRADGKVVPVLDSETRGHQDTVGTVPMQEPMTFSLKEERMKKVAIILALLAVISWGVFGYSNAATAQRAGTRIQELEDENAELKEKLDNIQTLVAEAKSDLDDVETDVQSDEPCEETSAHSHASDVEDKLNEIESEASY